MMMRWITLLLLIPALSAYPQEKPGECIRRFFAAVACKPHEIITLCKNDFSCPGIQKCCRTGVCVTQCENPAAPKPGRCPAPSQVEMSTFSNCSDQDQGCGEFNSLKCCVNSAGFKRCTQPVFGGYY